MEMFTSHPFYLYLIYYCENVIYDRLNVLTHPPPSLWTYSKSEIAGRSRANYSRERHATIVRVY